MRLVHVILVLPLLGLELWAQPQPLSPASDALTLTSALQLAKANNVQFRAAQADAALAKEDRVQARSTLLPTVTYNDQFLYTQGNGTPIGRFLANNAVHEYVSQGNAHEVLSVRQFADYRKAGALAALARAKAEVASRGLVVAVVQDYYAVLALQRKLVNARVASDEASRFLELSEKLEKGGEVAHSDVLKAQLQFNDKKRDLSNSETELLKSRMDLAVLILPSLTSAFKLADDLDEMPRLLELAELRQAAAEKNPELKAALAALQASQEEVSGARAEHLPSLSLDYFYGIDATHFAVRTDGIRNLGYAASATLNIPIFSWGATQSKVRQSLIRKDQAKLEFTTAQKQLLANIETFYSETQTAASQLATLRESVGFATESLRLISLRYQAGESTVLEVVDAQNTLNTARNTYVEGARRYKLALANLQTLTGTL
jgi:outer membrane protein